MAVYVHIIGDSNVQVWGLTGRERLQRMLARLPEVKLVDRLDALAPGAAVVLLHGDYIFDSRLVKALLQAQEKVALHTAPAGPAVAARTTGDQAISVSRSLNSVDDGQALNQLTSKAPADLASSFALALRKFDPPQILAITPANRTQLEKKLFSGAYKGVTDLVTKWLWPVPARWATRLCISLGMKPNHVTLTGLALAIVAGFAFYQGAFGLGLLAGWIMTFLDTVDGKLARVTVSSSRRGDVLDHGTDLVHPPLWYLAWGLGLGTWTLFPSLEITLWVMFLGYAGGRLCEGIFELWLAKFSLFLWRPIDSLNRLITARRNPNLILLTGAWLAGRPDAGLWAVAAWHGISTLFLTIRVVFAWRARRREGTLQSWLDETSPHHNGTGLAAGIFIRPSKDRPNTKGSSTS